MGHNRTSELKFIVVWICWELQFSISSVSIYFGTQSDIRVKIYCRWFFFKLQFSISSVSIYYGTKSDIRVKSYCRLNLLRASVFNFKRLDILWDSIGHPCKNLSLFDFSNSFCSEFRASRYITGHNRTSESKDIVVWICSELPFSITSVSIYYGTQSNIRVKSYCRLNLLRASFFNYERLDILRDSIGHPSKKLLSFEFAQSFYFKFRASRHIMGLNRTSV